MCNYFPGNAGGEKTLGFLSVRQITQSLSCSADSDLIAVMITRGGAFSCFASLATIHWLWRQTLTSWASLLSGLETRRGADMKSFARVSQKVQQTLGDIYTDVPIDKLVSRRLLHDEIYYQRIIDRDNK